MAYVFQIAFELPADQIEELKLGASLERVLGYLRVALPSEDGFVTSRAMRSLDIHDGVHVIVNTIWETWDDVQTHRQSGLAEDKVLVEFGSHIVKDQLITAIYEEID